MTIREAEVDENGVPQLGDGVTLDVWQDPVEVVDCDTCGKKTGVYWEKKYPKWGTHRYRGNEYLGRDFNGMGDLTTGLIRIIGRYWHQDSTYIVRLKAQRTNGDSGSVLIKIVEPSRLVSERQAASPYGSLSKTKDVDDAIISVDSLCIYYGGLYGIPPQFMKGHISHEAAIWDFGGSVGYGLAPSYRYEPYTIQTREGLLEGLKSNQYFINDNTNVDPPDHANVQFIPYFSGDPITVWQVIKDHSEIIDRGGKENRIYGFRTTVDTMNFGLYTKVQNKYHEYFEETDDLKVPDENEGERLMTLQERADSTNRRMVKYLRDEFKFYDKAGTKGMENMIAQTRLASSYGYFQLLFTTAILKPYYYPRNSSDYSPEKLNENDVLFPFALKMYNNFFKSEDFINGLEEELRDNILDNWNTHEEYPQSAIKKLQKFHPQK